MDYFCPDRCVKENTPPAFIWHTAEDTCVPVISSLLYAQALSKYEIPFELNIFPKGEHGSSTCDAQTIDNVDNTVNYNHKWLNSVKEWLKFMNLC